MCTANETETKDIKQQNWISKGDAISDHAHLQLQQTGSILYEHADAVCHPGSCSHALRNWKSQPCCSVVAANHLFPWNPLPEPSKLPLVGFQLPQHCQVSTASFLFQHCDKLMDQKLLTPHMKAFCSCVGIINHHSSPSEKIKHTQEYLSAFAKCLTDLGLPIKAILSLKPPHSELCPR